MIEDNQKNEIISAAYWFLAENLHDVIDYPSDDSIWINIVKSEDPRGTVLEHLEFVSEYTGTYLLEKLENIDEFELCREVLDHHNDLIEILESWLDVISSNIETKKLT